MFHRRIKRSRTGGIYIAVLATALVVALLGMSAMIGQRLQNRMIGSQSDIRQAQLNANTAVELALLAMKLDTNWRTTYSNGNWFVQRSATSGTCTANVTDPIDGNLANSSDDPVVILGIGYSGEAEQRMKITVDPRKDPSQLLRDALEAAKIGAPLAGQATTLDWSAMFSQYQGTSISIGSLPTRTRSFSRNMSLNDGTTYWTRNLPNDVSSNYRGADGFDAGPAMGHSACLYVERNDWREGVANLLNVDLLKPATSYAVAFDLNPSFSGVLGNLQWTNFRIGLIVQYSDGTTDVASTFTSQVRGNLVGTSWTTVSGTLQTPTWSQQPRIAYLVINSKDSDGNHKDFYVDNLDFYETGAYFIHQKSLGPGVDQLYSGAPTNSQGLYSIDCQGNTLVIERSRILGTLLLINPGSNSRIENGPLVMSPFQAGYPALLVNGNFTIKLNNRALGETENSSSEQGIAANFNPTGMPYDFGFSSAAREDSDVNDIYPSEIGGLVAVSGNLAYSGSPRISGPAIVGGSLNNNGGTLRVEYQPESLLSPPPGFTTPYKYFRREASLQKAVAP
jgi:hypothetical protein